MLFRSKANWSSILDFHGVIYFLQKNTRLYTDVFLELQVSRFSFHYKPSLDLARIMILTSRRGLRHTDCIVDLRV